MTIVGVVLAGGQGHRMGGADKALLRLGGRPLIAHVLARFAPGVAAVAISANGDPARFADFGCPVLPDHAPGFAGPLAGVLAGLDWALALGAEGLATVAVDTPFFPGNMVERLTAALLTGALLTGALRDAQVAMADSGDRLHPTCAVWRVGVRVALSDALAAGERRVARFAAAQGMVRVAFDSDADAFFNLNDPADLAAAQARVAR